MDEIHKLIYLIISGNGRLKPASQLIQAGLYFWVPNLIGWQQYIMYNLLLECYGIAVGATKSFHSPRLIYGTKANQVYLNHKLVFLLASTPNLCIW